MLRKVLSFFGFGGHTVDELSTQHSDLLAKMTILGGLTDAAIADRTAAVASLNADIAALVALKAKF